LIESVNTFIIRYLLPNYHREVFRLVHDSIRKCILELCFGDETQLAASDTDKIHAPEFLFVSTKLAAQHHDLLESKLVLSYQTNWPGMIGRKWNVNSLRALGVAGDAALSSTASFLEHLILKFNGMSRPLQRLLVLFAQTLILVILYIVFVSTRSQSWGTIFVASFFGGLIFLIIALLVIRTYTDKGTLEEGSDNYEHRALKKKKDSSTSRRPNNTSKVHPVIEQQELTELMNLSAVVPIEQSEVDELMKLPFSSTSAVVQDHPKEEEGKLRYFLHTKKFTSLIYVISVNLFTKGNEANEEIDNEPVPPKNVLKPFDALVGPRLKPSRIAVTEAGLNDASMENSVNEYFDVSSFQPQSRLTRGPSTALLSRIRNSGSPIRKSMDMDKNREWESAKSQRGNMTPLRGPNQYIVNRATSPLRLRPDAFNLSSHRQSIQSDVSYADSILQEFFAPVNPVNDDVVAAYLAEDSTHESLEEIEEAKIPAEDKGSEGKRPFVRPSLHVNTQGLRGPTETSIRGASASPVRIRPNIFGVPNRRLSGAFNLAETDDEIIQKITPVSLGPSLSRPRALDPREHSTPSRLRGPSISATRTVAADDRSQAMENTVTDYLQAWEENEDADGDKLVDEDLSKVMPSDSIRVAETSESGTATPNISRGPSIKRIKVAMTPIRRRPGAETGLLGGESVSRAGILSHGPTFDAAMRGKSSPVRIRPNLFAISNRSQKYVRGTPTASGPSVDLTEVSEEKKNQES